jgi:hypothetical protein
MMMNAALVDLIFSTEILLLLTSPVIVFVAVRYYFSFVPSDSKKALIIIVIASFAISPFIVSEYENLTAGLGFRIFLTPFFYAKWVMMLISACFIMLVLYKKTSNRKQPIIIASAFFIMYATNSPIIDYTINARYPVDTLNNTAQPDATQPSGWPPHYTRHD